MQGFLSRDMTYSCAIFSSLDADLETPSTSRPSEPELTTGASTPTIVSTDDEHDDNEDKTRRDELYSAQMRKLRHIIRKADIKPGHRILEIGSGWGSLSLIITQSIPGTTVDTLTLSAQQAEYVQDKLTKALAHGCSLCALDPVCAHDMAAGASQEMSKRIRVHLMDYRAMPAEWKGSFDRVVSVEMVEAVGREFLEVRMLLPFLWLSD